MTKKEIILIFILTIVALVRFFFFIPKAPNYQSAVNQQVQVKGIVISLPDVRQNNQRITIQPTGEDSNILAVVPWNLDISYGDKVSVRGLLEEPESFITSVGKEFNYKRYLSNQDIYFIIKNAKIKIISHNNKSKLKSLLYKFKNAFIKNIKKIISPPQSDLANGLILGKRGGFNKKLHSEFISTGTIHIVALSGYNVTIVAEGVMKMFGLIFSQAVAIISGILVIILFIIMTGASATAIRAGVMAVILLFGRLTGRTYDAGRALIIAALLMITYDLRTLTNISFQLSFLATAGVLFLTPKIISWFYFLPMRFKFRELVATTISATISVLPILLYITGILSLVSLPTNVLIIPFLPITMFFTFIVGILGFISPVLSIPFAYILHLLLSYILSIIHFFSILPFASISTTSFPLIFTILIYAFLIWWVFKPSHKLNQ